MIEFTNLTPKEIERRRHKSIKELKRRDRADFEKWYQEECDRLYFKIGPCCAGCDYWQSEMGNTGFCTGAGIVSGDQVMRSLGIDFCSYTPPPGFPCTNADFKCGLFKDEFDWSSLPKDYLRKIGAARFLR